MAKWTLKPQERPGTYRFNGRMYITHAVAESITIDELMTILFCIEILVWKYGGLDYLQVFESDTGLRLYFVDQLNDEMKQMHPKSHNFATVLFDWEY